MKIHFIFSAIKILMRRIYEKNSIDIYYRNKNLSAEQWERFNLELQYSLACNLPYDVDDISDINVNDYAALITETYKSLINKHMPMRKKTRKQSLMETSRGLFKISKSALTKNDKMYKL